ncbi:DinB family protein [Brevibacillus centrosporus]|uniref:DinB family protein n=1 Tax=Brevibacillus centrosporus TaxID=54910 RepID=UPI000F0A6B84|nr:DinB family protein [Brevibacillus centrosporus]MEC2130292.1 DinB family protein [Brevibacillus centrosporus]RNB71009.1 DUF664 domain-containing protein [Brevibacillus centrosporus]GED30323.1 DNA damage-inducible protein DinB [Brevibacillus centrosporus]
MKTFFQYNWMVREQWYQWCEDVPEEELLRERIGGAGSILYTLYHIIDVECSWIRVLQGKPDIQDDFMQFRSLAKVRMLDANYRPEVEEFVMAWEDSMESRPFCDPRAGGSMVTDAWGEVVRHVIAHQIHHLGQLSIWAREVGKKPVSANVIGKQLISPKD